MGGKGQRKQGGRHHGARPAWRRHWPWIMLAIAVVGWLLRLYVGYGLLRQHPAVAHPHPSTDMGTYLAFARQVLAGEYAYSEGFYYQPFYYATFLPLVMLIFGEGMGGVVFVQSLLGAATVWLCGMTAARLFGKRAGIVAATLLAISRMHIFYTPFALIAVLQGFLLMLLVYLTVLAWQRRVLWLWLLAALVAGFGNVTRGNIVLLMPLLVLLVVLAYRRTWRQAALIVALVAVTFYLPQLPYAWVNYQALGRWVGPSSAAGAVLALGNTPESPPGGREPEAGAGPMSYPPTYHEWMRQEALPPAERVTVGQNIWRWVQDEPLAWLELKGRMMLLFWSRHEIPNNVAVPPRQQLDLGLLYAPFLLDFLLIGTLGLTGLCFVLLYRRRHYGDLFVGAGALIYSGSIVLFYVLARFRLPVVPLLAVLGGYGAARLYGAWRLYKQRDRQRPLLVGLLIGLACFAFVGWGYDLYRAVLERPILSIARPDGVQARLQDSWLITDAGPRPFGGWMPVPVQESLRIDKEFVLPDEVAATAAAVLRVPVYSSGGIVETRLNGGDWQPHTLEAGMQTLVLPLADAAASAHSVLELRPRSTAQLMLLVDTQRDYGRTRINNQPATGELVADVRIEEQP